MYRVYSLMAESVLKPSLVSLGHVHAHRFDACRRETYSAFGNQDMFNRNQKWGTQKFSFQSLIFLMVEGRNSGNTLKVTAAMIFQVC